MTLYEFIPWLAMAGSMALILILPLLSERLPELPRSQEQRRGTADIYFRRIFW